MNKRGQGGRSSVILHIQHFILTDFALTVSGSMTFNFVLQLASSGSSELLPARAAMG